MRLPSTPQSRPKTAFATAVTALLAAPMLTMAPAMAGPAYDEPAAAPAAQERPEITWEDCPEQVTDPAAECGRVEVPTYHDAPERGTISVGFVRQKATSGNSRGALFGNPGGPGGDAYEYFAGELAEWPEGIESEWDRIGVQPRGLPGSTQLECDPGDNLLANDPLTRPGGFWRSACENSQPGYSNSITTQNTAHDWEWVRRALDYERISIMGLSYGTYLGSAYATAYPQHTDRVVLDSAMDPFSSWSAVLAQQKGGFDRAYEDFFTFVAERNDTYHLGTTALQVYNRWSDKILRESGLNPTNLPPAAEIGDLPAGLEWTGEIGTEIMDRTGQASAQAEHLGHKAVKPGAALQNSPTAGLTHFLVPQPQMWDKLARNINGSINLQEELMAEQAPTQQNMEEITERQAASQIQQSIILCNENLVAPRPALLPEYLWANYAVSDIPTAAGLSMASGHACNGAPPVTGMAHLDGSQLETQPLQISGTGDPQTVYHRHQHLANLMNAHVVTVHGPGHGHVAFGNKAVEDIVVDYLRTGDAAKHSSAPGYFDQ